MTFWTFSPKSQRWRFRRRCNLDFDERKWGLERNGRVLLWKEIYFRLCRTTGNARFYFPIIFGPILAYSIGFLKDPNKEEKDRIANEKADELVRTTVKIDPVLGNPEITLESFTTLVGSNYGFGTVIDLISLNKKSNEFWETLCFKVDEENDLEKWSDYID